MKTQLWLPQLSMNFSNLHSLLWNETIDEVSNCLVSILDCLNGTWMTTLWNKALEYVIN